MRRFLSLFPFLLLVASAAHADLSGFWTGTYSVTIQCPGGGSISSQGSATAMLSQSGSNVSGTISVSNFNAPDTQHCTGTPVGTASFPASGTWDGTTLTLQLEVSNGVIATLQGTASDTAMNLRVVSSSSSGAFNFTKDTSSGGAADVSGTWSGNYEIVELCGGNPQEATGTMTVTVTQNGSVINGTIAYGLALMNCTQTSPVAITDTFTSQVFNGVFPLNFTDPHLGAVAGGGAASDVLMTIAFSGGDTSVVGTLSKSGGSGLPSIASFSANPQTINAGQSAMLTWTTSNATSVTIDNGVGAQGVSGSVTVAPGATTTYTLTATNGSGSVNATTTVIVNTTQPPANVVVSQFPTGMLQLVGQSGATDHYTLLNSGGTDATVTLTQNGNFFTQSPASFTLPAGASRTITITATAQPAGTYEGASIAGNLTIPIRLLVAAPPQGTVVPTISGPTRVETVASIGETQGSGSVTFTNSGSATLYGIAVSDVPWMTPQGGLITIPPGGTVTINYTIDRTKRTDAASPLGGARCTLSLRFLNGTNAGKWAVPLDSTNSTSSVSISLVDVVKPGVAAGTPPPLGNGEVALFVPGISSKPSAVGDLLLSNRSGASIADLKLFFGTSGGAATQVSALQSLVANAGVTFPGVVRNVFGANGATGSVQLRSSQIGSISVATVQANTVSASTSFATALPILRSDRGARAGDALYLAGVAKNDHQKTNLELQEMSGNAATVATDFLDANGNVVASRSDTLAPFAFVEVADAVPAGAVTARVKNPAGSSAIVGAYALVIDSVTNDAFAVTDLVTSSSNASTLFAPLFPPVTPNVTQSVSFTNVASVPINVTATAVTGAGHHRASAHAFAIAPHAAGSSSFTLAPLATATFVANGSGYVKVDAPAGSLRASATYAAPVGGTPNVFGSGLPVQSTAQALVNGAAKRFAGVEAASASTVAQATPATYRSNLMLIETAGATTTVRVTLTFTFLASANASATATASKDFEVPANSAITIIDLATAVLGIERSSVGDLHQMRVDVNVVGGSGKVLPLLESIDNASGDVVVRND